MRLLFLIILILITTQVHSQKTRLDTTLVINNICERFNRDQSNYNDSTARSTIFVENFNWLIITTKEIGFPNYKLGRTNDERKCIGNFTFATLTHISQTNPQMLIDTNVIHLIKSEIIKGNIDSLFLMGNLNYWYSGAVKLCLEEKEKYEFALRTWGLNILQDANYYKCNY